MTKSLSYLDERVAVRQLSSLAVGLQVVAGRHLETHGVVPGEEDSCRSFPVVPPVEVDKIRSGH